MVQVTVEQAASDLGKLLEEVKRGEEFGIITYVAEDFDAALYEGVNARAEERGR